MFPLMYNIEPQKRLKIVQFYFNNGQSMRETAKRFRVHYQSVFKWVKLYKKQGEERILSTYRRPWNRADKELEDTVVRLVEKDPTLTVRKAKEILEKEGISISIKGIWGIWKRYGYAGFDKKNASSNFTTYIPWTKEAAKKFKRAKEMFANGEIKKAACLLNSIPSLPKNEVLPQIPDPYLSLRRRVEKIFNLFGRIPMPLYIKKTGELYGKCMKAELNYSALRVGLMEIWALIWSGRVEEQLKKIEVLKKIIRRKKDYYSYLLFEPRITILISEGVAYTSLLRIKKAYEVISIYRRMLVGRKYVSTDRVIDIGGLYKSVEDYREAEYWFLKALKGVKGDTGTRKILQSYLSDIFLSKGEYKKALSAAKDAKVSKIIYRPWLLFFRSILSLVKGMPQRAISLSTESLSLIKKEELNHNIFHTAFTIASGWCSLGERKKAEKILRGVLQFHKKNKLKKGEAIFEILLSGKQKTVSRIRRDKEVLPTVRLALLIKDSEYLEAFSYANEKYLLTSLYRYIFFFPEVITNLLEEGKQTHIPKAILKLPVFNKEAPVYNVKMLGGLTVYKNQKYLRVRLQPKESAFLIHLVLKAGEPDRKISLEKLYRNFWAQSKHPERNLSHLLVRLKKALKIPSHLLEVSYRKDSPYLINRGIHFTTDYDEFKQTLARAKAFHRAGEWFFAKKEYISAFSLFRGDVFRKMYDNWSDDKRLEILFSYENEVLTFARELISRRKGDEAVRLLKNAEKILIYSEEIKELLMQKFPS